MKVWNYTIICLTMMLLFQFAGFPTAFQPILGFMGIEFDSTNQVSGVDIEVSNFWDYLLDPSTGLLATLVGAGVTIGLLVSGKYDIAIRAAFASAVLFAFIPTLIFSLTYAVDSSFPSWATALLAMIFIPLTGGYFYALVEYIFGTD